MTYEKVRSNVYLDKNLKEKAKELFKEYGLSLSDGLNMLLKQAIEKKDKFLIPEFDIEPVYPDDPDYKIMQEAKKDKSYTLEEARNIKKLKNHTPTHRLRVGDYRVLFDIEDNSIIVGIIRHRQKAYEL